ncbi:hypothetical protein OF848_16565 [Heyndrickxia coagulans]|uniref:EsaB/YukD family protein n=1 Tax=Heyndrickxia coagulans TaxID=1398 RepID=UPI0021F1DCF8|nr:EsaB/YukD family protein [Heyndrickxia coagulans]UYM81888.1 hypothetical protein OF848_16565 [Heyndrickxia coagulans]
MPAGTHLNVTVDFQKWQKGRYDVRIPAHQPVRQLLSQLMDALGLDAGETRPFAVKIPAKKLVISDDDRLWDFTVANGDILVVL